MKIGEFEYKVIHLETDRNVIRSIVHSSSNRSLKDIAGSIDKLTILEFDDELPEGLAEETCRAMNYALGTCHDILPSAAQFLFGRPAPELAIRKAVQYFALEINNKTIYKPEDPSGGIINYLGHTVIMPLENIDMLRDWVEDMPSLKDKIIAVISGNEEKTKILAAENSISLNAIVKPLVSGEKLLDSLQYQAMYAVSHLYMIPHVFKQASLTYGLDTKKISKNLQVDEAIGIISPVLASILLNNLKEKNNFRPSDFTKSSTSMDEAREELLGKSANSVEIFSKLLEKELGKILASGR